MEIESSNNADANFPKAAGVTLIRALVLIPETAGSSKSLLSNSKKHGNGKMCILMDLQKIQAVANLSSTYPRFSNRCKPSGTNKGSSSLLMLLILNAGVWGLLSVLLFGPLTKQLPILVQ